MASHIPTFSERIAKHAAPRQTFIWLTVILVPIMAFLCAMGGLPLAGAAVSFNPANVASMTGSILCPANTVTTKLVTPSGNSYGDANNGAGQVQTPVIKCYDAQGAELPGKGDSFTPLWFGAWTVMSALVGAVITFNLLFVMYKLNQAHAVKQQGSTASIQGGYGGDEELEELKRLEQGELAKMKQNNG